MNHNAPITPRPLPLSARTGRTQRLASAAQLRAQGVPAAEVAARCRPGGWQQLLPGVFLLQPGPPTSEDRLHAALLYARRPGTLPQQEREAMITGLAALTLHRFSSAPPLTALERIDVLVPRTRRLRSTGWVRVVRTPEAPEPVQLTGVPVAPVARAVADAVSGLSAAAEVRALLTEAVRGGHCEPAAVVRELSRARLLSRPHVVDAVDALLTEGRSLSEERLYELVREFGLPDPLWNVDLRLPGGPHLGGVDAYWPDQAVAVELDTRAPRQDDDELWSEHTRKREHLERLGITVVHLTPRKLREAREQQATVVRTALMAAPDRHPAAYVVVLPR
ncbi:hypothetical protein GCM10010497_44650 [Streptomyces cinereoruber]|uniref:Transcriptional regulator, AbiEi antitoxin, Type IV TA system n=1 Tax=Streptomyces cinereoruber TaxID=67260 RepID=A0AAV4KLI9_9ACTN|nr:MULTISPECIES: hypothetical protein [Streptomyces]MBB4156322.1 hypothetical protein [Streptomyces cinereoruber]MBY8815829.1 hypothetical protein [Streptomyces cinereoruber]NIH61605.1 hypothetical protein [Streptomyces cinereoruber]PVC70498.1 hypothetical protein DBP18_19015 [Streptomyces sp. CS081A]QEV32775.1 hypothetical protein CP977_11800 [Streptomyces cinereoruber]